MAPGLSDGVWVAASLAHPLHDALLVHDRLARRHGSCACCTHPETRFEIHSLSTAASVASALKM
eukprot:3932288-Rhodomonas_salina.2